MEPVSYLITFVMGLPWIASEPMGLQECRDAMAEDYFFVAQIGAFRECHGERLEREELEPDMKADLRTWFEANPNPELVKRLDLGGIIEEQAEETP